MNVCTWCPLPRRPLSWQMGLPSFSAGSDSTSVQFPEGIPNVAIIPQGRPRVVSMRASTRRSDPPPQPLLAEWWDEWLVFHHERRLNCAPNPTPEPSTKGQWLALRVGREKEHLRRKEKLCLPGNHGWNQQYHTSRPACPPSPNNLSDTQSWTIPHQKGRTEEQIRRCLMVRWKDDQGMGLKGTSKSLLAKIEDAIATVNPQRVPTSWTKSRIKLDKANNKAHQWATKELIF